MFDEKHGLSSCSPITRQSAGNKAARGIPAEAARWSALSRQELEFEIDRLIHRFKECDDLFVVFGRPPSHGAQACHIMLRTWIGRQTRSAINMHREMEALRAGEIGANPGQTPYCSHQAQLRYRRKRADSNGIARNRVLFNPILGNRVNQQQLFQQAETKAYAETLAKLEGVHDLAMEKGFTPLMVTLTLPAEFQPQSASFSDATIADSLEWLGNRRKRLRERLEKFKYFMFRVIEPHRNGYPHEHAIIWAPPEDHQRIAEQLNALYGHSASAIKINKIRLEEIHKIFIYLMKSMVFGNNPKSESMHAWHTIWKVRRFSFIGLPKGAGTLWRLVNSLGKKQPETQIPPEIAGLIQAMRERDYSMFCRILNTTPVKPFFSVENIPGDEPNTQYTRKRPIGIFLPSTGEALFTRTGYWQLLASAQAVEPSPSNSNLQHKSTVIHNRPRKSLTSPGQSPPCREIRRRIPSVPP